MTSLGLDKEPGVKIVTHPEYCSEPLYDKQQKLMDTVLEPNATGIRIREEWGIQAGKSTVLGHIAIEYAVQNPKSFVVIICESTNGMKHMQSILSEKAKGLGLDLVNRRFNFMIKDSTIVLSSMLNWGLRGPVMPDMVLIDAPLNLGSDARRNLVSMLDTWEALEPSPKIYVYLSRPRERCEKFSFEEAGTLNK